MSGKLKTLRMSVREAKKNHEVALQKWRAAGQTLSAAKERYKKKGESVDRTSNTLEILKRKLEMMERKGELMWTCFNCQSENDNGTDVCQFCGLENN